MFIQTRKLLFITKCCSYIWLLLFLLCLNLLVPIQKAWLSRFLSFDIIKKCFQVRSIFKIQHSYSRNMDKSRRYTMNQNKNYRQKEYWNIGKPSFSYMAIKKNGNITATIHNTAVSLPIAFLEQ